jgi:retron-type reverse transcriptase
VNYVLDADIKGFFDNLDKSWLIKFVEHRVADPRILRLIQKWLKAGVMEEGKWSEPQTGSPQGSVISPLLANIYLHYCFDLWVNVWHKKWAQGEVVVVRYADDTVFRIPVSGRRGSLPGKLTGATGNVWAGATPRKDAPDRVRQVRREEPEA